MTASCHSKAPAQVDSGREGDPHVRPDTDPDLADLEREAALVDLFDRHHTQMVRLAVLLGADTEAEDVVSEAFCELHRRWYRLQSADAAPAYLRAVVCNLVRMRIRHLQVVRKYHQLAAREAKAAPPVESAEAVALAHSDHDLVVQALHRLSTRQREALVLRYWMELKDSEIAHAMGISIGAVKSHIFRGLNSLSDILDGQRGVRH